MQTQERSSGFPTTHPVFGTFGLLLVTLPSRPCHSSHFLFLLISSSWQSKFNLGAYWGRKGNLVMCALLTSFLAHVWRSPGGAGEHWAGRLPASFLLLSLSTGITPVPSKGRRRRWALRVLAMMSRDHIFPWHRSWWKASPAESERRISPQSKPCL